MKIIKEKIYETVKTAIEKAKSDGVLSGELPELKIEYPRDQKFGDYSTPFAMESARIMKQSPLKIGENLIKYLEDNELFEKTELVKPGFINFYISLDALCASLKQILSEKENFGKLKKDSPKKINIEFVSANPTGPLNVVSARAAALGDTLANLLEAAGDIVDREFYVNDHGNQVFLFGKSVMARFRELSGEKVIFPEDGYQGEYIKDIAQYIKDNNFNEANAIRDENELIAFFSEKAIDYILNNQKAVMEKFGVKYKKWFRESTLHKNNEVMTTLAFLEEKKAILNSEGKKLFNSTKYGDDKDRVVLRKDGRPTYLLADIAYHKNKFERGYDEVINIWGPDHHGYIARLKGSIAAMGFNSESFKVLIAQQVNLLMEGNLVKMSKRLGRFSTMQELIDEVGVDASRYFFVMRSMDSHLDFDLTLAKRESSENPVFYLQYAHARICSVFREASKNNFTYDNTGIDIKYLDNEETIGLLKLLSKYPEEVKDAAVSLEPHRIANYLLKLAGTYHKFYTEHRILTDDRAKSNTYLSLCDAVRTVLKNGLGLLGVSSPEKM